MKPKCNKCGGEYKPCYCWPDPPNLRESKLSDLLAARHEVDRLRVAIKRLGSMEAFTMSRAVRDGLDDELIARIDFARKVLNEGS